MIHAHLYATRRVKFHTCKCWHRNQLRELHLHKKLLQMSHLTRLQTFLIKRLDIQRTGGSVFIRDDQTLILTDKDLFSNDHHKLIESKFPNLCIDVVSSTGSRSGFFVLFTYPPPYNRMWQRSVLRLGMHCACFVYTLLWSLRLYATDQA